MLEIALTRNRLSEPDRALCRELTFGVARWETGLDWWIAQRARRAKQKAPVQILLRMALYQLAWLDRVPDYAAVDETLKLGKKLGFSRETGFMNALLRACLRDKSSLLAAFEELKHTRPHLAFSHPEWLVDRWIRRWGRAKALELLAWNNTPPKTFARVNRLKINPDSLQKQWRSEGVEVEECRRDWIEPGTMFELKKHPPLKDLGSFRQGYFYAQDPGTLLSVAELDPQPGERVLDACAAPGGKCAHIAERMRNQGRIYAQDESFHRVLKLEENCERLGATIAEPARPDVIHDPELSVQVARMLIDAPCSNTGVMRRRVDLRRRLQPASLTEAAQKQAALLERAALQVQPGGRLVYSTCSLEPEENEEQIRNFIGNYPDFTLETERLLTPMEDRVDGAYVARLTRRT